MRYNRWTNKLLPGLVVVALSGHGVQAQIHTNATCASSFNYMNNSLNQSPCLVAAYLQGACSAGIWNLPALPPQANGQQLAYSWPNVTTANLCFCSWAVYNLMSACGACQEEAWYPWTTWSVYCLSANLVSTQPFPAQISVPLDTVIPEYAGKNPTTWTNGMFNITEARAIGSYNLQIGSSTSSSATGAASTASNVSPSSDGGGGPPVGPIVGGVVGGLLGLALIAVLAVFLLCPARLRRRHNPGEMQQSTRQEKFPADPTSQTPPSVGATPYNAVNIPNASHQQLLAAGPLRPPLAPRFTSSLYSSSTADHSVTSSMALQPVQQVVPGTLPYHPPPPETIINPTPSPPNSLPEPSSTTTRPTPSVRSFLTRAMPRHGHAPTPSDTSVTSASSLFPRIQQSLRMGQSGSGNDVVVPFIITPSTSNATSSLPTSFASTSSIPHFQGDRKVRPTGLQYTPPPPVHSALSEPGGSDGSTISTEYTLQPPASSQFVPATPMTIENAYGMIPPTIMDEGEIEADRRTNMSPANASSILEAAPPYVSDEQRDLGGLAGRGGIPLRQTPRLPDVDEYPEEKARFTNAAEQSGLCKE